jgi:hypothetical protein
MKKTNDHRSLVCFFINSREAQERINRKRKIFALVNRLEFVPTIGPYED